MPVIYKSLEAVRRRALRAAASAVALAAATVPALAQEAAAPQAADDTAHLQDIVVTARRLSESLQNTPVSVSALGGSLLDNLNTTAVDKISQLVPNVSIVAGSGSISGNTAFIRGIGSQEPLLSIDSPVGIYLDGVYLGRQAANNLDLVEPERIEVLRGPQGTLFGRNTTGGAVSIISRTPPRDFGGSVKAGYGSFDKWFARASLDTGEIGSSGLAASFAYLHRARQGFVDTPNSGSSRDPGALRSDAAWGRVHGEWDKLKVDVTADWNKQRGQRNPFEIAAAYQPAATYFARSPTFGGDPFVVTSKLQRRIPLEFVGNQTAKTFGVAATVEYDFSTAFQFKSITAWRGWDSQQPTNYAGVLKGPVIDFTSPTLFSVQRVSPFVAYEQDLRQRQFSQELQVLGHTDSLSYVVGAYYFNERSDEYNTNAFTLALPPAFLGALGFPEAVGDALTAQGVDLIGINLGQTLAYRTRSESLAGFAQLSWKPDILDRRLELTGGLRYTHDKRSLDQASVPAAGPIPSLDATPPPGPSRAASASFNNWSYLASVNMQWLPNLMTYARVATGYKSGGFDARAGVNPITGTSFDVTFRPEKATSFEIGFKSEFFDRRVRLNADWFYTKYKGLQVSQYSGGNGFVPNADAHYQGFEVELTALPLPHLQLDGSVGYTRATYDKFLLIDPATGIESDYRKAAKFPYAPRFTAHVGAQYMVPMDWAELTFRVDFSHSSKRYFHTVTLLNPLNDLIADRGQDLLSARIALGRIHLGGEATTLEIGVYGENLLQKDLRIAGIDFGPSIGIAGINYGEPRSFGVDAKLKF